MFAVCILYLFWLSIVLSVPYFWFYRSTPAISYPKMLHIFSLDMVFYSTFFCISSSLMTKGMSKIEAKYFSFTLNESVLPFVFPDIFFFWFRYLLIVYQLNFLFINEYPDQITTYFFLFHFSWTQTKMVGNCNTIFKMEKEKNMN